MRPWLSKRIISNRSSNKPYLNRIYLLPRNKWFNCYLHIYSGPDDISLGLHDHPWHSLSIRLWGSMYEYYGNPKKPHFWKDCAHEVYAYNVIGRYVPIICYRKANIAHAVFPQSKHLITVFFTGKVRRTWGFFTAKGWADQKEAQNKDYSPSLTPVLYNQYGFRVTFN